MLTSQLLCICLLRACAFGLDSPDHCGFCMAGDGVTIKVGVQYESRSPRRIALRFQEAGVSDVHITNLTETLIAPALLPRGWLQQRILLASKEVRSLLLIKQSCIPSDLMRNI